MLNVLLQCFIPSVVVTVIGFWTMWKSQNLTIFGVVLWGYICVMMHTVGGLLWFEHDAFFEFVADTGKAVTLAYVSGVVALIGSEFRCK